MSDEVGYTSGERVDASAALRSGHATPIILTSLTLEGTAAAGYVRIDIKARHSTRPPTD